MGRAHGKISCGGTQLKLPLQQTESKSSLEPLVSNEIKESYTGAVVIQNALKL